MNTQQLMEGYKNYLKHTKKRSENTIRGYVSDLKHFLSVTKSIENITRVEILDYVQELNKTLSAKTVHRRVASIQSLFDYMLNYGIVKEDVSQNIPLPAIKKAVIKCPESTDIKSMIENEKLDSMRIALQLGSFSAMRASEVCNLKVEDIDFDNHVCILRNTKTAKSRVVALDDKTIEDIKRYVEKHNIKSGVLLRTKHGKKWSDRNFSKYIQKHTNESFHFHLSRHYCITEVANNYGVHIAKELAGHSSILTTQNYLHPNQTVIKNALNGARGNI